MELLLSSFSSICWYTSQKNKYTCIYVHEMRLKQSTIRIHIYIRRFIVSPERFNHIRWASAKEGDREIADHRGTWRLSINGSRRSCRQNDNYAHSRPGRPHGGSATDPGGCRWFKHKKGRFPFDRILTSVHPDRPNMVKRERGSILSPGYDKFEKASLCPPRAGRRARCDHRGNNLNGKPRGMANSEFGPRFCSLSLWVRYFARRREISTRSPSLCQKFLTSVALSFVHILCLCPYNFSVINIITLWGPTFAFRTARELVWY